MNKLLNYLKIGFLEILSYAFPKFVDNLKIKNTATKYDMYKQENESYYSRLYLYFINDKLNFKSKNPTEKIKILDIGCGQGRLAIPLSEAGYEVTGIDFSLNVLETARQYAKEKDLNINFHANDAIKFLSENKDLFDCIICTEVIYMISDYEQLISLISKNLKPGGQLFLSYREKYYYLLHTIMKKRLKRAIQVSNKEKDIIGIGGIELNWHTHKEMLALLTKNFFTNIEFQGIGILSGIEEDPFAKIIEPKFLSKEDQDILFEIETKFAKEYSKSGRYVLASAIKS